MRIVVYIVMNVYGELLYIGERSIDDLKTGKIKVTDVVENRNSLQDAFIWGKYKPKEIGCHQVVVSYKKSQEGKIIFKVLSCTPLITLS